MAAKFTCPAQRGETHRVDPDHVVAGQNFSRWRRVPNPMETKDLAARLRAEGRQITPAICKKGLTGAPELVAGWGRLEAIKYINSNLAEGEKPWLFEFVYMKVDDTADSVGTSVMENAGRRGMSHMDWATSIHNLMVEKKWTQDQIGEFVGKSQGFISQHYQLLKLDAKTQTALEDGKIGLTDALSLCNLGLDERQKILDTVTDTPPWEGEGERPADAPTVKELAAKARGEENKDRGGNSGSSKNFAGVKALRGAFDVVRREVPQFKTLLVSIENLIDGEYTPEELAEDFALFYQNLLVDYHRNLQEKGLLSKNAKFQKEP